jgi:hypothetical protein
MNCPFCHRKVHGGDVCLCGVAFPRDAKWAMRSQAGHTHWKHHGLDWRDQESHHLGSASRTDYILDNLVDPGDRPGYRGVRR